MNINDITQRFTTLFPGDKTFNTHQRNTPNVLYALVNPAHFENIELVGYNQELSNRIGLGKFKEEDLAFLGAQNLPEFLTPYATAYAGHQFGNWAGQLGDGRAIFAGEITNPTGERFELQWKGAGATPYSRFADGRAVLRSSVREYLMSEAMFHLGVPTTRALSLVKTGENVTRDPLYNGKIKDEPGAIVLRVAPSFLRYGHFELLSAQKNVDLLRQLADFTIENYFPDITSTGTEKYKEWFTAISQQTVKLIVEWYRVGFIHGVMNTDNMSIIGQTIDYGPYSMLEDYDLNFTSNTTDLPSKRYTFGNQGKIAQWNLWQLANALFPLIQDEAYLEETLNNFSLDFWLEHDAMLCRKFGIDQQPDDEGKFFTDWQDMMTALQLDHTLFFIQLEKWRLNPQLSLFEEASYKNLSSDDLEKIEKFLQDYENLVSKNFLKTSDSIKIMAENNPKFILRNYMLQECIEALEKGDDSLFKTFEDLIKQPYHITTSHQQWIKKRPSKYDNLPGCTMLSCSS